MANMILNHQWDVFWIFFFGLVWTTLAVMISLTNLPANFSLIGSPFVHNSVRKKFQQLCHSRPYPRHRFLCLPSALKHHKMLYPVKPYPKRQKLVYWVMDRSFLDVSFQRYIELKPIICISKNHMIYNNLIILVKNTGIINDLFLSTLILVQISILYLDNRYWKCPCYLW